MRSPYSASFCFLIFINGLSAFGMVIGAFWALRSSSASTFRSGKII